MHSLRILAVSALSGALLLSACNTDSSTKTEESVTLGTGNEADDYNRNVDTLMMSMPKPSEVPYLLEKSGADFNPSLINSIDKASDYNTTSGKAAINLGVYTADLSYKAVYEKIDDAKTYLKSSHKLAETAGVANAFPSDLDKRFEKNANNSDSVLALVDDIMHRSNQYLKENQRQNTSTLIFAGSFIEGLYISTGLVENYPKDIPAEVRNGVVVHLVRAILEQKKTLGALINMLEVTEQDQQIKDLTTQMKELHTRFEELNVEDKIKNNQGDLILNDNTLKGITAKVKEIRNGIVS